MSKHPRAGQPAHHDDLIQIPALMAAYYVQEPNPRKSAEQVKFGTSGHRGSSLQASFNEAHVLAMSQAICAYRAEQGITGPILLGKDTHALSEAAFITALEVFIGNGLEVHVQADLGYTPTPVISHEILRYNQGRSQGFADGVVITPSHNPPQDGGFKYNPPHGGPAESAVTNCIEKYANAILSSELVGVKVVSYKQALKAKKLRRCSWLQDYTADLAQVLNMPAIQAANLHLGVNAMGGAGMAYWQAIKEQYGLQLTLVNDHYDPQFAFMTLDKDGAIRMDCSSPEAMASLLALRDQVDLAVGNDPDYDRHGIVTSEGLMNPNHYLAVCIDYLLKTRSQWSAQLVIGKTLVSSAMIDRVVAGAKRQLMEVPVGFKWFAQGLAQGEIAFAGEESAGASFLDLQGQAFSSDKDGIILALLAAEIQAVTGKSPAAYYRELEEQYGRSYYQRCDQAATAEQMLAFTQLVAAPPQLAELAGEPVLAVLTKAPGNQEEFGGIKVTTANGWFAARPSGTEPIYKIYAESLTSAEHLAVVLDEAQALLNTWLR